MKVGDLARSSLFPSRAIGIIIGITNNPKYFDRLISIYFSFYTTPQVINLNIRDVEVLNES
jgi:hypothetical protein